MPIQKYLRTKNKIEIHLSRKLSQVYSANKLLTDAFNLDGQFNRRITDQSIHAKISQLDRCVTRETSTISAPWVLSLAKEDCV